MNVEAGLVAVVEVRVDHGRAEVVRGSDGVHVAGEVEVEQLHRDDLAVAAAGGAALAIGHLLDGVERDLCGARPERLEVLGGDAGVGGDLGEWTEIRLGGDLEIGREGHGLPQRNSAEPGPGLTSGERTSVFHDAEGFRIVESAKG